MQDLTPRQREVLEFVTTCIHQYGYSPTIREIGRHLGIKSTNGVTTHIRALEAKGYLVRDRQKNRTLRPAGSLGRQLSVPLLGSLAGTRRPFDARDAWDQVCVDRLLVGGGKDFFVVRMGKDFEAVENISPGDYVFVRRSHAPEPGDLILEYTNGAVTIVRKDRESGPQATLPKQSLAETQSKQAAIQAVDSAANEAAGPATGRSDRRFLGTVVGFYRKT
jgi:repressor LexA